MPRITKAITPLQVELIDSGFRPGRQAWAVRLARRLLWPLVRPFHFYNLDRTEQSSMHVARLERELEVLSFRRPDETRLDRFEAEWRDAETGVPAIERRLQSLETAVRVTRLDHIERRLDSLEYSVGQLAVRLDEGMADLTSRMPDMAKPEEIARLGQAVARVRSELTAIGNRHIRLEEQAAATRGQVSMLTGELSSAVAGVAANVTDISSKLTSMEAAQEEHRHALDGLTGEHRATGQSLQAMESGLAEANGALQDLVATAQDASGRLSNLQTRFDAMQHGLFLTHAREGIFLLQSGELISESVRKDGVWDRHIIEAAEHASAAVRKRSGGAPELLAIDVGGHFGLITVPLARIFDRVITFEPNAFNATLLRTNVVLNGLAARVDVRREALAASPGTVSLAPNSRQEIPLPLDEAGNYAPEQASNLGAYSFVPHGTGMSEAKALALDSLGLESLAFLKIDVQGGDGTVLMGAMDTIARCKPWVIFEWEQLLSRNFAIEFQMIEDRLRSAGYLLSPLHRHNAKQTDYLAIPENEFYSRRCISDATMPP